MTLISKVTLSREKGGDNPNKVWREFIDRLTYAVYAAGGPWHFTDLLNHLFCAITYEGTVYNGGIWFYFLDWSQLLTPAEVLAALKALGADEHATLLEEAIGEFNQTSHVNPNATEEQDAQASALLHELDDRMNPSPTIDEIAKQVFVEHEADLVDWVD